MMRNIFVVLCLCLWAVSETRAATEYVDSTACLLSESALLDATRCESAGGASCFEVGKSYCSLQSPSFIPVQQDLSGDLKRTVLWNKYGGYIPLEELEVTPIPLVAFGFFAKANKKNFRAARNNFIPSLLSRKSGQIVL